MKIGNVLLGVGMLAVGACAQVVVHPELESSNPVPPLTVVTPVPEVAPQPVVEVASMPEPEPTFADLSPSTWTLQIAAVKSLREIQKIEASNALLNETLHIPTHDQEHGDLHAVLVGVYSTPAEALQIANSLPSNIAGDKPWIRSVASVQAVMR